MSSILSSDQLDAVNRMFNGCILAADVGAGKSRTSIAYYFKECGGIIEENKIKCMTKPLDLYIITTARKRDSLEWESELVLFGLSIYPENNTYKNNVVIDSWNNVQKYSEKSIKNAFFIFDEQKVVSFGKWAKAFIQLSKMNKWILLSATPGDTWSDYIPVFIANGYFKSKTEFYNKHCIFSRFSKYPKIERYYNEGPLIKYRKHLLIDISVDRHTVEHDLDVQCSFDKDLYLMIQQNRWDPFKNEPIENPSEFCYITRKVVNSDHSRLYAVEEIINEHPKVIIFYSYDYELDLLHAYFDNRIIIAEWNGHKHEPVPNGDRWIYLVEYLSGAEAWNCITTDTIIFYSQQYSYRCLKQSCGRINRRNTPYIDLYHYHLKSRAPIDQAIGVALRRKKKFNESGYFKKLYNLA